METGKDYDIITFIAEPRGRHSGVLGDITGREMLRLLHDSAKAVNPATKLVVLTTPETEFRLLGPFVERVDCRIEFANLMLDRLRSQRGYVQAHLGPRPFAVLDTDILLTKDLRHVFNARFDIGLTWRRDRTMPINGGVVLVNNERAAASKKFFDRFLDAYLEERVSTRTWYGDQLALNRLFGHYVQALDQHETGYAEVDGVRYAFFPCSVYNLTPTVTWANIVTKPNGSYILHFKGGSRFLMSFYWRLHVAADRPTGFLRKFLLALTSPWLYFKGLWYNRLKMRLDRKRVRPVS